MTTRDRTLQEGFKKHRLAIALSACLILPVAAVQALGIGDIDVDSALNENLSAKIELSSVEADDLNSLDVRLASKSTFARMEIDRSAILSELNFEVVSQGPGAPYVKVSSSKPIREPFLDFVLDVRWASGQVLREYTLLLDPPIFEAAPVPAVVAAPVTQASTIIRNQVTAPRAVAPRTVEPGNYGPTARKDTLWSVASQMRPNTSVSVPQMMIALLKENPEAFVNGNINNLKAGYILRAPHIDAINALSKKAAINETNLQNQTWLVERGKAAPVATRQSDGTSVSEVAAASKRASMNEHARLQLLAPEDMQQGVGDGSTVQADGDGSSSQKMSMGQLANEAVQQENIELRERLVELEKQLESVQRLIELKDDTFTAMQEGVGKEQPLAVQPEAVEAEAAVPAMAEKPQEAVVAKPEPKKPVKKPLPAPVQAETSLIDDLLSDPLLLGAGGGGVVLLLLLASYLRKRRQKAEEDFMAAPLTAPELDGQVSAPVASEANADTGTDTDKAVAESAEEQPAKDEDIGFGDFVSSNVDSIQAEESEIDPIAEADVYLAYRRYEQAEALLKEAIRVDDRRGELKLKLLEIYYATKDKDSFEAQAEALYATLAGEEEELWEQALEMGREICPAHPLFADSGAAALDADSGMKEADVSDSLELDDDITAAGTTPVADDVLSDNDLADSLGLSMGDDNETSSKATSEATSIDADGVDLDLDLGDELDLGLDTDAPADDVEAADTNTDIMDAVSGSPVEKDEFDLDAGLADAVIEDNDLAASLDDLEKEMNDLTSSLELGGDDAAEMTDLSSDAETTVDIAADESSVDDSNATPDWDIAPAISSFETREVKSEMDDNADLASNSAVADVDSDLMADDVLDHLQVENETPVIEDDILAAGDGLDDVLANAEDLLAAGDGLDEDLATDDADNLFDASDDAVSTKLDLAKAYIDMGDQDGARVILDEVAKEGDDNQRQEAEQLKQQIS